MDKSTLQLVGNQKETGQRLVNETRFNLNFAYLLTAWSIEDLLAKDC